MIALVGGRVDATLAVYLTGALASLMSALVPLALAAQTLWTLLFGVEVLRGRVHEPVTAFAWRAGKVAFVCAVSLTASTYGEFVQDGASGLMVGMAASFLPPGSHLDPASIWTLLDSFSQTALDLVLATVARDEGTVVPDLQPWFAAALFAFGDLAMLVVAFCVTLWVRVVQCFVFAVGPLFILGLIFEQTARFFNGWLAMLASTVVLTWLVYFVLGFSLAIGSDYIDHLKANYDALNLIAEALVYVVVMVAFAFLVYQAPGVAAALTGGGPSHFGAGVIHQALSTWHGVSRLASLAGLAGRPGPRPRAPAPTAVPAATPAPASPVRHPLRRDRR